MIFALSVLVGMLAHQAILDDGYIYLVVTRNILTGEGWRFNPSGTIVNPCTSPLYTLLLVGLQWMTVAPIAATIVLYSLGTWAASTGLFFLYRERSRLVATVLSLYYTVHPIFFRSIGLETSLFIAALIWTALLWGRSRHGAAAACACAASLLRIDGILLLAALPVLGFSTVPRVKSVKISILSTLPLIGWFTFSYLYFGHCLPQSVQVKNIQANFGFWYQQGPWIVALLSSPAFPAFTWLSALFCLSISRKSIPPPQRLICLFGGCQILVYGCAGAPAGYPWYYAPACLTVDILFSEGFLRLEQGAVSIGRYCLVPRADDVWAKGFGTITFLWVLSAGAVIPIVAPRTYPHATDYREVAEWINKRPHRELPTLAAAEIGYLGYFGRYNILDVHGLIHPTALLSLKQGEFTWWYAPPYPDYITVHSPGTWDGEPSPRWPSDKYRDFQARYDEVLTTMSGSVKVYARHQESPGGPPAEPQRP